MIKLLRNLLKSPMFVIGISIFVLTLLIALFGPIFYSVDTHARDILAGPYAGSSSEHLLGTLQNTCSVLTTLVVTMCPC